MLTRELLRYKVSGAYAKPSFIKPADGALLNLAARLIAVYENSVGSRREDLDFELEQICASCKDIKLARGLCKILADRSEFSGCDTETDHSAIRHEIFRNSACLLASEECPEDPAEFRRRILENYESMQESIYPDLPENERLLQLKKIYPKELLERYNMSLVQSLLLFSNGLECKIHAEDPALLRRLFKYLKFFRLLFQAELSGRKKEAVPEIKLKIDGPASILENSTRYGLQLASFFPAVCSMKLWKISSELKLRTKTLRLSLDETCNLSCHYLNFGAYIPEEFRMFQDYFNTAASSWQLVPRDAFLQLENGQLAFPDFRFRSFDGIEVDVELFHQWHRTQLEERIAYLEKHPDLPLILGADRVCLKKDDALKERFSALTGNFLFTSFPGVENVEKSLNKALEKRNFLSRK
ncbi:MAG: DUF790 family protein [Lentisphaeria bacterium]|nr:DUF790 family protein [Lentisphaeria bacterium]